MKLLALRKQEAQRQRLGRKSKASTAKPATESALWASNDEHSASAKFCLTELVKRCRGRVPLSPD